MLRLQLVLDRLGGEAEPAGGNSDDHSDDERGRPLEALEGRSPDSHSASVYSRTWQEAIFT